MSAQSSLSAAAKVQSDDILLEVENLKVHFPLSTGLLARSDRVVHAVDGVSFKVRRGTAFGLVGESGSGKTTAAQAVARLVEPTSGRVALGGTEITSLKPEALRQARRHMQFVFQDPFASLNPRERAGAIVRRPLDLMKIGTPAEREARVDWLIATVGLRPEQKSLFPHQFSGGQRQRIGIARALATSPELVIFDESVSALDVAIQAQILNLMARLKDELDLTYLFISHDLGVVQHLCEEIAVMYLGRIVEQGTREAILSRPLHPYTVALVSAAPSALEDAEPVHRVRLQGEPPSPIDLPGGCRFRTRCPFAQERCAETEPELQRVADGRTIACHRVDEAGRADFMETAS